MRDIRDFMNMTDGVTAAKNFLGRYIDLTPDGSCVDEEVKTLREKMRQEVKDAGVACRQYSVDWADDGITEKTHVEYMWQLADDVKNDLLKSIKAALDKTPKLNSCLEEAVAHTNFCSKRANGFYGKETLVSDALRYFKKPSNKDHPLVIYGISGSGKTSLMAKLAFSSRNILSKAGNVMPLLISRFCGTSPHSSSAILLMKNLSDHIDWLYLKKQPKEDASQSFRSIAKRFQKSLSLSTENQPLLIFIDSLDQLNDDNQGRSDLSWLPDRLPEYTFLVLSTIPDVGGCLKYLHAHSNIPDTNYLEVKPLEMDDASSIVQGWLEDCGRTLPNDQLNHLLSTATDPSVEPPTMLRLKLLFDMAKKWTSYEDLVENPVSVRRLINKFFEDLEKVHGEILVSHLFGLMAISKQGLGESELLDILSGNEKVLDSVFQYHKPPVRRLPQIVFARLRNAVGDYLVERGTSQNKLVLSWYHRQFWEAAEWKYLYEKKDRKYYGNLIASYFSMEMHSLYPERGFDEQPLFRVVESEDGYEKKDEYLFNESKIWELPSALLHAQRFKDFEEQICNLTFLAAAVETGIARDLIAVLREAVKLHSPEIRVIPPFKMRPGKDAISRHRRFEAYSTFLATNMHIFQKQPKLVHQQAMNTPTQDLVHQDASLKTTQEVYPWTCKDIPLVTLVNKPEGKTPCLFAMSAHDEPITDIVRPISSPRDMDLVLTSCKGGLIICYNLVVGNIIMTLHAGFSVTKLALLNQEPSGTRFDVLACCCNGVIRSWTISFESGQASSTPNILWQAHDKPSEFPLFEHITMALSRSTQYLVTGTTENFEVLSGRLKLWDLDDISENSSPTCLVLIPDVHEILPLTGNERFGVAFLNYSPQDDYIVVALGKNKTAEHLEFTDLIVICSARDLKPLHVVSDVMFQPHWVDVKPLKWWTPTFPGENLWSMLISTSCSQLRVAVSSCPENDVKTKVLWAHQTDYNFHSSVLHPLSKVAISGLGCNVKLWDVPDTKKVSRDKWDDWDTSGNYQDLHNVDTFRGHGHTVEVVQVSEHDNLICTGATNGVLKVWQISQVREYKYAPMHKYSVSACAVAPDGSLLATGSDRGRRSDAEVHLWNPATGELLKVLKDDVKYKVTAVAFSPDSKIICYKTSLENCVYFLTSSLDEALKNSFTVKLGNSTTPKGKKILSQEFLNWSASGAYVLATSSDVNKIWIIDVGNKQATYLDAHEGIVLGGRFIPDDKHFATWCSASNETGVSKSAPSEIKLFDFTTRQEVSRYVASEEYLKVISDKNADSIVGITTTDFIPTTQRLVAATTSGHVITLSIPDMNVQQAIQAHTHSLSTLSVLVYNNRSYIVTGYSKIRIWDAETMDAIAVYHNGAQVTCLTGYSNPTDNKMYVHAGDTIGKVVVLRIDL